MAFMFAGACLRCSSLHIGFLTTRGTVTHRSGISGRSAARKHLEAVHSPRLGGAKCAWTALPLHRKQSSGIEVRLSPDRP